LQAKQQQQQQQQQPGQLETRVAGWQSGNPGRSSAYTKTINSYNSSSSSSRRMAALGLAIPGTSLDPVKQRLLFDNVASSAGKAAAAAAAGGGDGGGTCELWVNSSRWSHCSVSPAANAALGVSHHAATAGRVLAPTLAEAIFGTAAGGAHSLAAPSTKSQQLQKQFQQPLLQAERQPQQPQQQKQQPQQVAAPYMSPEAATFMAAINRTAQYVGLDVQQAAGGSPNVPSQTETPAAAVAGGGAFVVDQLEREVDALRGSFAKQLEREKVRTCRHHSTMISTDRRQSFEQLLSSNTSSGP
jgi:hypothetical protein